MGCTRPERIGAGPGIAPARSFLPLVFDLAEESRCQNGVGPLDVGEVRGQERPLNFKSSIIIGRSHSRLLVLADNEVFVTVPGDLERIVGILCVDHLPRNSDPLDAHPVRVTALSRQIEMVRRIKAFIPCLLCLFSSMIVTMRVEDHLLPKHLRRDAHTVRLCRIEHARLRDRGADLHDVGVLKDQLHFARR